MKSAVFFLVIGAIIGAYVMHVYEQRDAANTHPSVAAPAAATRSAATDAKDSLSQKLAEWKLTPDDIKQDLARTGEVVRSKAAGLREGIADARVVAVIKAKYLLDSQLSALAIDVDCHGGEVTLKGSVQSPELIGRAIALALETSGVHNVVSRLTVKP